MYQLVSYVYIYIQTSTAATHSWFQLLDFYGSYSKGFSLPSPSEDNAEVIPVGDDSPDLVPQFSNDQQLIWSKHLF